MGNGAVVTEKKHELKPSIEINHHFKPAISSESIHLDWKQ